MQGLDDRARQVLLKIHSHSDAGHDRANLELYQIKKQMIIDRSLPRSWVEMFKKPNYRRRALLGLATTGMVQFSGVLVINSE